MRLFRKLKTHLHKDIALTLRTARSEHPLIVRWWTALSNWGDALNPVLVRHLTGVEPIPYSKLLTAGNHPVYSVIGSMLDQARVRNLVVWGSGFMHEHSRFALAPVAIHAVRGPLTRSLIERQGLACPDVYGDPALLYPRFYRPNVTPSYRLGLIAHFRNRRDPALRLLADRDDVLIIDILDGVESVVDQLCSCDAIASSSLHGLIAADAYGIPSAWIRCTAPIPGGGFKFRDYFASVGREDREPLAITEKTTVEDILRRVRTHPLDIDLDRLIEACPFRDQPNCFE